MDWIRENKPLAVILGIIIAGSLGLGYMLFESWNHYTETKDNYLNLGSQVAGMKGARLAPTAENLKIKQALVDEYAGNVNKLAAALLILQPSVPPIKDIEFQAKLKTKIAETRKSAGLSKMALPPEFALGFDEYTKDLPKSAEAATELSSYVDAMAEIVKLFMNSGVESLDLLERSKLTIEQDQPTNSQPGNVRTGMPGQAGAAIFEKRQISAILTLDQGALQLLASRFANPSEMPYFTTIRLLRIENQRQEGPLRADMKLPSAQGEGGAPPPQGNPTPEGAKPAASDEIKPPPAAPVDSIPVIGEERLKVRMEIDLVKFLDAAKSIVSQQPAGR